jgi:two-component system chemotaxis response regulator CheY
MQIMIVDDSSTMRKIIIRALRQSGHGDADVSEASDGVEGLAKLEGGPVDLIFSDVNMPNMNGIEFVKNVRANAALSDTPIIMVTTEGGDNSVNEALAAGANGYVTKPFTPEALSAEIEKVTA